MDLDEEGRIGLGFWGLGRREEDGEHEIESLKLDLLTHRN